MTNWDLKFKKSLEFAKKNRVKNVISVYNTNIDFIVDFISLKNIKLPKVVLSELKDCMKKGIGGESLIDERTFEFLKNNLKGKEELGGNSGIFSNTIAHLGIKVLPNVAALTSEQKKLFTSKNVILPKINSKKSMIHFIIEFKKGYKIDNVIAKSNNRFIATYDPLNSNLVLNEDFNKQSLRFVKKCDKAIISGLHLVNDKRKIDDALKLIEELKKNNPNLFIHFGMGNTKDENIRKYLVENVFTKVDSIDMNEEELDDILRLYGKRQNIYPGAKYLFEKLNLKRLNVHHKDIGLTFTKGDVEREQLSMLFGSLCASYKSRTGKVPTFNELIRLNKLAKTSKEGLIFERKMKFKGGLLKGKNYDVVFIINKPADKPIVTVGLGDTMNAGIMAVL